MWIEFNPNPTARKVGDCAVRAVAKALDTSWEEVYWLLAINGFEMGDMPNGNSVWGSILRQNGFKRRSIPDSCPDCYTAEDFCEDHPEGTYVLSCGSHVMTVVDGDIYDTWDSSKEVPQYVWYKKEKKERGDSE